MRHILTLLIVGAGLTAAACDGPRENAGEEADFAANRVGSEDTLRSGPAEEMGAKQDAAAESRADAIEARADSLEASADEAGEAVRQRAKALREQARSERDSNPPPATRQPELEVNGM